jgi:hypothetical protein
MFRAAPLIAAVTGLFLVSFTASAQPGIPATYFGSVTVDGQPAPEGLEVHAFIAGVDCAQASTAGNTVIRDGSASVYRIAVVHESQREGCAREGSTVTFVLGTRTAVQTARWQAGPTHLDLSTGAATVIPLPSPAGSVPAAGAGGTPDPAAAPTSAPTLSRPTGTAPAGDAQYGATTGAVSAASAPKEAEGGGGDSLIAALVVVLILVGGAGAAAGVALSRRRRCPST